MDLARDLAPDLARDLARGSEARRRPGGGRSMTAEAAPLLTLRSISKTYAARDGEPVEALKDVSCTIRAGDSSRFSGLRAAARAR